KCRRYISLCFDISCTTISSYLTGGINSAYVLVYLWIYIGYGTRYGKNFLLTAVVLTLIGYNILLYTQDAWNTVALDAMAFLVLIIALPAYLYSMQKRLQGAVNRAESANQAKTEFLSNMTHQIRTPIGGIVGMIDLLNKTTLDPKQNQYLQALSQSSNALQEIIEDLIDFSRIEQGKIFFNHEPFNPRTLLNSLVHSLAPLSHEKNLEINYYISQEFPHIVFSDAQRLRQALSNLVRYAIENNAHDSVYLHAYASTSDTSNEINTYIDISFNPQIKTDNPISGIDAFTDDSLALRVGSQLIRLLGGSFDIQHENHNKTSLNLHFIWKYEALTTNTEAHIKHNRSLLIYESDAENRGILENYCKQLGYECYSTEGANNLIAHIVWSQEKNKLFDALILCEDIKKSNALGIIPRIRAETGSNIPILYATYIQSIEMQQPDELYDIQASINKPISLEELDSRLDKLIFNQTAIENPPQLPGIQYNILVADDSEINASVIYNHLTDKGHNVDIATDGNTALYAMHKHHYDIVFMDLHMPNMDGIEATQQWRKLESRIKPLPIIAITAKATSDDKASCLEAGMSDFLTKPVSAEQLEKTLNKFLNTNDTI
ncbi:MAG: response regulator, partial [Gammaproteobacteria bacterium]|nr:response regulator [Gammaproteobacteria bacterium]